MINSAKDFQISSILSSQCSTSSIQLSCWLEHCSSQSGRSLTWNIKCLHIFECSPPSLTSSSSSSCPSQWSWDNISWTPTLTGHCTSRGMVFKSITIIIIQWLVLEAREDGETSHEKLLNSVLIIRKFVALPLVLAAILAQAVIIVGWIYENRVTIVKCFENILCSQSQVSEDPVIELAVISHNQNQNWAQEPIHIQNPVQNFEIFHILISTVIVILYLVNLVLVVFLTVSTFFARTLILLATINTTCYSWFIFNKKLRSHTKSVVIKLLSLFNNIFH